MRFPLSAAMLLASCGTSPPAQTCPSGVLIVTQSSDYSASGVGVLPLDGSPAMLHFGSELGSDPALATSAGRHFFVARGLDTIFELDACAHSSPQSQFATRNPSEPRTNPQDVAVAPDGSLWIARLGVGLSISIIAPDGSRSTIDLGGDDSDGNPDATSIRIIGGTAFVALERLNPYPKSIQPSQIAVIDVATRTVTSTVTLKGRNPFGLMVEADNKLWLASPGNFSSATEPDAGIEVFDTVTRTSTLVLDEPTLGGSADEVAISGSCGAAIIADASTLNVTSLATFRTDGTNLKQALAPTPDFTLRGLLFTADGRLLLGDRYAFVAHTFLVQADCTLIAGPDLPVEAMPVLAFAR